MADKKIDTKVWFSGLVQGVGFRYETLKIAKGYEVTGFVKNLNDGRVYLLAQGIPAEVKAFIEAVSEGLSDYIREKEETTSSPEEIFRAFDIRR